MLLSTEMFTFIYDSFETGYAIVFDTQHVVIQPLIKKPNLDQTVLNIYQSQNYNFHLRLCKKLFFHPRPFLDQHNSLDKFQSGFRMHSSIVSAPLRVTSDLLLSLD